MAQGPASSLELLIPAARHRVELDSWTQNLIQTPLYLSATDENLRHVLDTTYLPPGRSYELLTWTQNLIQFPFEVGSPFAQLDWPVPKGYEYPSDLRTGNHSQYVEFITHPDVPWQLDWPLPPRGYPHPVSERTWTQEVALGHRIPPTAQLDWPVPLGYEYPPSLRAMEQGVALGHRMPPHAQLDWPVPKGYPYPPSLRAMEQGVALGHRMPPTAQLDWPVPKGYPPNLLRTHTQLVYTIPTRGIRPVRRTEQVASNVGRRSENLRGEVTAPNVGRRQDE